MVKNLFSSAKNFLLIYKTKLTYYISITLAVTHYYWRFNRATTKTSKIYKIVNLNIIFCLKEALLRRFCCMFAKTACKKFDKGPFLQREIALREPEENMKLFFRESINYNLFLAISLKYT